MEPRAGTGHVLGMTTSDAPDHEVWARLVAGQAELFAVIYQRHADSIYGYSFRRTGCWSAAEDVTSIVFLEAWRRRRDIRFGEDGSLRPWLFGVANNTIANRSRTARRHRAALARLPHPQSSPDPADELAGRLDDEARMRRVLAVFGQLGQRHQEVLALTAWAELDIPAAALALGVPAGTVKSRLHRARAALARLASEAVSEPSPAPPGDQWEGAKQ
jgi:RNA polymerase sigma factor (sigma-70 family)